MTIVSRKVRDKFRIVIWLFINSKTYLIMEEHMGYLKNDSLHLAVAEGSLNKIKTLLRNGANIDEDDCGRTPLYLAIEQNSIEIVLLLISNGASVDVKECYSPLYLALERGYSDIVKLLIENGANVNHYDMNGDDLLEIAIDKKRNDLIPILVSLGAKLFENDWSKLHSAARSGNLEAVKIFVEDFGLDVNSLHCNCLTPLSIAVEDNWFEIVKYLIKKGADVEVPTDSGGDEPVLYHAVQRNDIDMVKLLVLSGADLDPDDFVSPIYIAIENRQFEMVELLISLGCDLYKFDENGTLLHNLASNGDIEMLEAVSDCKINFHCLDEDGRTLLHYAAENKNFDMIKFLISKGLRVDDIDQEGISPMQILEKKGEDIIDYLNRVNAKFKDKYHYSIQSLINAIKLEDYNHTKKIISSGVNVNWEDEHGNCPIHFAVENNDLDIVRLLVESGADVNVVNKIGFTPLHVSAGLDDGFDVATLLVYYGAKIDWENNEGMTPLDIALDQKDYQLIELLRNA